MKIESITASNFLGAKAVDVRLIKPVALFAGCNGAGKSSLQEAIRMALTGATVRVDLKKDYAALITEGKDSGFAEVVTSDGTYSVVLPSGKGTHCNNDALPFVLDAQRFSSMDDNERRQFLFGLMGINMDSDSIRRRLIDRLFGKSQMLDDDVKRIDQISPILRAGFDAAQKDAANKARDAKAGWKAATGGETWGKDKAEKWQPPTLEFDAEQAEKLTASARQAVALDDADIGTLQQEIGAARSEIKRRQQGEANRLELKEKADQASRIKARLDHDTAELVAWEQRVADCRIKAGAMPVDPKSPGEFLLRGLASVTDDFLTIANNNPGVFDESLINRASTHLAEYKKLHGWPHSSKETTDTESNAKSEAVAKLPEYENALKLMQSAVANGKRDLEAANAAKAEYDRVITEQSADLPDIESMQAKLREITARRDACRSDEQKYSDMAKQAAGSAELAARVAKLHQDVMAWTDIADALAPDGIPGELLAEALGPINERLHDSAGFAEWEQVVIHSDMRITYGLRDYALISESEKWRTDAMIAESVSFLAGVKLLVLDRFDVLDLKGREDLMYWLDGMASDGEIDTAMVFGTLKALPALNFDNIEAFWIDNGSTGQIKQAA